MTAQTTETPAPAVVLVPGDMGYQTVPVGLTEAELIAYRKGYDRGDRAYLRKTGGPAVVHDGDAPAPGTAAHRMLARTLAENGRAYRVARHAPAHKAGMSALRSYLRKTGQLERLEEIADPLAPERKAAPKTRKAKTPEPAADVLAAGVESGRVVMVHVGGGRHLPDVTPSPAGDPEPATVPDPLPAQTWAARKQSRRELAAAMRAAGIKPSGDAWEAAKAGTPLSELVTR